MKIKGKAWKFSDNVNTDEIIPAKYLNTSDPNELGRHCMEGIDRNFSHKVSKGDVIVAGKNFGCGSSREHAPVAIKARGISCVVAESFARIFYRNAINIGLPIFESKEAAKKIRQNDRLEIDFRNGLIKDLNRKDVFKSQGFPKFLLDIIKAGGLMKWVKKNV